MTYLSRLIIWIVLLTMLVCLLAGCGAGLSLTDGSIPIGDIDGTVNLPSRDVTGANLPVELVKPSGEVQASTLTDAAGAFVFHHVGQGRWTVRTRTATRAGQVAIDMTDGDTIEVVLLATEIDPTVTGLQIAPSATQHMSVGEALTFTVDGMTGMTLLPDLPVSWAVQGHVGTITPAGQFLATRAGSGLVVAQYGDNRVSVQVIVSPGPGGPTGNGTD